MDERRTPGLSVCVVTYEPDKDVLLRCLDDVAASAASAGAPVEVVVVDNGSLVSPPPEEELHRRGARLVRRRANGGFGVAMNEAVRAARAPSVLCLNPDTRVGEDFVAVVLAALARENGALMCGWMRTRGDVQVDALMLWWWSLTRLVRRPAYRRFLRAHAGAALVPVDKVSGGSLFASRALLLGLGPFDEEFFLYGEDADLSVRARAAGHPLLAVPGAVVGHAGGASSSVVGSGLVERARVDAALRLRAKHRPRWSSLLARGELALVTVAGLLVVGRTTSRDAGGRRARLRELRRWGLRRTVPRFDPSMR